MISNQHKACSQINCLSLGQQQLYAIYLLDPQAVQYNVGFATELRGDLAVNLLQKSLNIMVERHEALRSSFSVCDGQPQMTIQPSLTIEIQTKQLDSLDNHREAILSIINSIRVEPFNLSKLPLLRCYLLKFSEDHYVLIILIHHIITDAWSIDLMIKEIMQHYNSLVLDPQYKAPSVALHYRDFIQWQQTIMSESEERILTFWKKELYEPPLPLQLPKKNLNNTYVHQSAEHHFFLDKELSTQLKALAVKCEVSLFVCLFSAYQVLLARYTNQEDLVVGVPFFGREKTQFQQMLGYFINILPLRAQLPKSLIFFDLLKQNQKLLMQAQSYQPLSLAKLLSALKLSRSTHHQPLFQVLFNFVNLPFPKLKLAGLQDLCIWHEGGQPEYDLAMGIVEEEKELQCTLKYNAALFEAAFIQNLSVHYMNLLKNILSETKCSVWNVELMDPQEKHSLLVKWNQTQAEYPKDKTICQLFEEQLEKTPNAIALIFEEQPLSYQALNQRANQLAHYLINMGVKPESIVAIHLDRSVEMIIAVLGIWKAGAAYVPLDPSYPQERLQYMLEDTQASLLLTQSHLPKQFYDYKKPIVYLDSDWQQSIASFPNDNPRHLAKPHNLAYVIYTSGSTGKPKGVLIEHRGISNLAKMQSELFNIHSNSRVLQFSSMNFDAAVSELSTTFIQGATLCLVKSKADLCGEALINIIRKLKISVLTLPPSILATLPETDLPMIETLIVAGETPTQALVRKWQPKLRLLNAYGPTEASVCASVLQYQEGIDANVIGRPMSNIQLYILDVQGQPVPIGVEGELYIGGVGVARGYLNQPELTKMRFIANPFATDEERIQGINTRLYRSGDLARYLPDGNIEYLGRLDQQVKLRGYRIELGEVENALGQQPQIHDAVVLLREDEPGQKRLVAYIILNDTERHETHSEDNFEGLISQLRAGLQHYLPEYMLPSAFVVLEHFPLTINNKLDRKALPIPDTFYRNKNEHFIAPRNDLEQKMASIWAEILSLNVEQISMEDDFFLLGGNSLLILQLVHALEQKLNITVKIADIFHYPTIAALSSGDLSISSRLSKNLKGILSIKTSGTSNLFLVHPLGGLAFPYLPLAKHLDCAIYGVENPYFGQDKSFASLSELVDCYINHMKTIQTQGPYRLGGWSLGGNIALLMAQKLKVLGESIQQVILIDSFEPSCFIPLMEDEEQNLIQSLVSQTLMQNYERASIWFNAIKLEIKRSLQLLRECKYNIYREPVDLIQAETREKNSCNGWEAVLPKMKIYPTVGTHYELFSSQYIGATAQTLQQVLKQRVREKFHAEVA